MTENLTLEINNLRSIKDFKISLPIKKGVYAITGSNGIGKSTVLNALKLFINQHLIHISNLMEMRIQRLDIVIKINK